MTTTPDLSLPPLHWRGIPRPLAFTGYAVDVQWSYVNPWIEDADKHNGVDLDPDFQRGHVWTETQQVAFIEFCLRGGTSGDNIFWNCATWDRSREDRTEDRLLLVDGLQRVTAVRRFMADEIRVLGGYRRCDIGGKMRLHHYRLRMCVNQLPTRSGVLEWYLALNDGGVVHTPEEISRVRDLLIEESKKT